MEAALSLLLLTTLLATSQASRLGVPLPVDFIRSVVGSGHDYHPDRISCKSWRFGVETNNVRDWSTVPHSCEHYIANYMFGHRYPEDSSLVATEAAKYALGLKLTESGKDVWVFDIDETVLSNLPYFEKHGFGPEAYNSTLLNEWVDKGKAPALPESLRLYKILLSLGYKIVFLTGRYEPSRAITKTNLKNAGYHTWEKLILRSAGDNRTALAYKSAERKELEAQGYVIVGNVGDQWSDILGSHAGHRTFKLPNPMYYAS